MPSKNCVPYFPWRMANAFWQRIGKAFYLVCYNKQPTSYRFPSPFRLVVLYFECKYCAAVDASPTRCFKNQIPIATLRIRNAIFPQPGCWPPFASQQYILHLHTACNSRYLFSQFRLFVVAPTEVAVCCFYGVGGCEIVTSSFLSFPDRSLRLHLSPRLSSRVSVYISINKFSL